jgi:benzoyl-CoA reductase/2-hydroxyglutaryl-CoA dehydratase subunit BcrC/BadD/HgdB
MGTVDSIVQYVQDHLRDGPVAIKEASEAGKIILGMYCTYMPWELIHAAGAIGAGLCAKSSKPIPAAEEHLPRNLCPLIKASYGHALLDTCPYFHFCHTVLAETTCDGKKKMYELLNRIKPVYTLQIPQRSDRPEDLEQLRREFYKIREYLKDLTGHSISEEDLRRAIALRNAERRALRSLWELSREEDPPLSGMELEYFSEYMQFFFDKETAVPWLEEQVRRIREAWEKGERRQGSRRPRILVTGCPLGGVTKVIEAVENAGGTVVCYENCGGQKEMGFLVDETKDPMEALAEKYLATGCSVMSPNRHRMESLEFLMEHYRVEGVVEVLLTACHTYAVEAHTVRERVQSRSKKYLLVETDYSESDREQLATRMDAFIEML